MADRAYVVTSTRGAVKDPKLNGDCIDAQIKRGQRFGRETISSSRQAGLDYVASIKADGYPRTWCVIIAIFALLYLGVSIVTFVFASQGASFDLITASVDDFGNPTPTLGTVYPLPWIFAVFPLLVALVYGGVALIGGQDYLAWQMYGRAEAYTGPLSYFLHAGFQGAAALLFTGYLFRTTFFILSFGFAGVVTGAYLVIGNSTALTRGWSFETIIAFLVATAFNVIQWVLLAYGLATESLEGWEYVAVIFYIIGGFAYWANVLAWIFAWGSYKGVDSPRDRVDIYSIVAIAILLIQSLFIHVPYILYGLGLV
jgi:hypothetical protein